MLVSLEVSCSLNFSDLEIIEWHSVISDSEILKLRDIFFANVEKILNLSKNF